MRSVLLLLPLAACAAEPVPAAPGLRARQEAACTAVIAAHVRRAPDGTGARAQGLEHVDVLTDVPLQGEDADCQ